MPCSIWLPASDHLWDFITHYPLHSLHSRDTDHLADPQNPSWPQGLCTCCSLCLNIFKAHIPHFLQGPDQIPPPSGPPCWNLHTPPTPWGGHLSSYPASLCPPSHLSPPLHLPVCMFTVSSSSEGKLSREGTRSYFQFTPNGMVRASCRHAPSLDLFSCLIHFILTFA